jgi:hypothetical protein
VYTIWTQHLSSESEVQDFKRAVKSAKPVLDRVCTILDGRLSEISRVEMNPKEFENPSWSHKEAFVLGQKQQLSAIRTLLNLDQQDTK